MEEQSKLEELAPEPRQGSGNMLAAARKKQQKTIEEIAEELNLSVSQIKTIELDQTEGLPEPTYVRGYIRSYAKLLGLKPEEVLHNYLNPDWQKTSSLNDIPRGIGAADENSPGFFTPAKLFMLLLTAVLVTGLWYYGMLDGLLGSNDTARTNVAEVAASESVDETAPSLGVSGVAGDLVSADNAETATDSSSDNDAAVVGDQQEDRDAGLVTEGQNGDADSGAQDSVAAEPVLTENLLVMDFSDTSWVDIRDSNDQRLAYKSYAQGERLEVREQGELQVFIGNAAGVSVALNGAQFDLSEHREGVYAKFVIEAVQ